MLLEAFSETGISRVNLWVQELCYNTQALLLTSSDHLKSVLSSVFKVSQERVTVPARGMPGIGNDRLQDLQRHTLR